LAQVLYRLGMLAARKRWIFLGAWVVALVGAVCVFKIFGSNTSNNLDLPGTDSQKATDLLAAKFPPQQNGASPLVFRVSKGKVTDSDNKKAIQQTHATIVKLPYVDSATSPFSQQGQGQVSKDKQTAFIPVLLKVGSAELTQEIADHVFDASKPAENVGMKVAVGGPIGSELSEPHTESSEVIGLLAAMIILAFTFGTLAAMGLPIISAVLGLAAGLACIALLGHVATVPQIAPTLATMIGLGVGIDYALFLVTRYRTNRADGMDVHEAIALAVATSGSAIVFAGGTVVIALVTLLIAGIPLVTSLGYASAFAVVTAVLAALTLLPAVLSLVGVHIERGRLPTRLRPKPKEPGRGFWAGWARVVTGHPWLAMGAAAALLVPLIVPLKDLDLGQEDIGATPKATTERQAYDLIASSFGPGYTGPLLIAVDVKPKAATSSEFFTQKKQAESLQSQLEAEQKSGTAQQKQLEQGKQSVEQQQASLEKQQKQLDQEQKELESDAAQVQTEQNQLIAQKNSLQKQQQAVLAQSKNLDQQAKDLASDGVALGKQAAKQSSALAKTEANIRAVTARLNKKISNKKRQELEAQLAQLQKQEQQQQDALNKTLQQEQKVRNDAQQLLKQMEQLGAQQKKLAQETASLADQAEQLGKQSYAIILRKEDLITDASNVQVEAANTQTQAANLNTQKVQLQEQQKQAKQQQQQAEQLQQQLTQELTAAGGDERGTDPRLVKLQDALEGTKGIKVVSPPKINKAGDAAVFTAVPTGDPASQATADVVTQLRDFTIPQAIQGTKLKAYVGGQTASYVDLAAGISSRLMLVILAVVFLSFVVLLTAYRSLIVGAQAAVVNVVAVSAAFGVLTACFQWGWGLGIVGIDTAASGDPIASYVPLMMFAVLFGLSMDYQVFLLSQVEHHRAQGEGDTESVRNGLAASSKVIAAAALIMISVFGSFILDSDPTVKQFGVGLAVGVALAATSVLLLSPALLVLGSRASWWVPRWLDRILPHLDIEGKSAETATAPRVEAPVVTSGS